MFGPIGRGDAGRIDRVTSTRVGAALVAVLVSVAFVIGLAVLFYGASWLIGAVASTVQGWGLSIPEWVAEVLFFVAAGALLVGFFVGLFKVLSRPQGPY